MFKNVHLRKSTLLVPGFCSHLCSRCPLQVDSRRTRRLLAPQHHHSPLARHPTSNMSLSCLLSHTWQRWRKCLRIQLTRLEELRLHCGLSPCGFCAGWETQYLVWVEGVDSSFSASSISFKTFYIALEAYWKLFGTEKKNSPNPNTWVTIVSISVCFPPNNFICMVYYLLRC